MNISLAFVIACWLAFGSFPVMRRRGASNSTAGVSAYARVSQYDNYRRFVFYHDSESADLQKEKLHAFALHLQHEPQSDAWILSYGGRTACVSEAKLRGKEVRKYLIRQGINRRRIKVIDAGYYDEWAVELWLVIRGTTGPQPTPNVNRESVQIIKQKGKCAKIRAYDVK